jgi:ubiquinone/menaquinone biosynthesis C-methylase UbiE
MTDRPPVCDYEGSRYQTVFWERGGRQYEDQSEAIALRRLLPKGGHLLLELGAGAGRNTPRYAGFERVVLLDYSRTQLQQAQERLGRGSRYVYVAADIYRLPFVDGLFDAATMIRTLHHMADAPAALHQVRAALQPGAAFILEFANKQNMKAILRWLLRRQSWSPFAPGAVEFVPLNFDFHPRTLRGWLREIGFRVERSLTVSHFRLEALKRLVPTGILVGLDSILQWTGGLVQLSPSVFLRARAVGETLRAAPGAFFKCPACGHAPLDEQKDALACAECKKRWGVQDGIYDFKDPT